ncbi:MAG: hypothetical protein GX665_12435 [Gammaproteobacteria bacterium]|nr:hypothetical protein [Gammaproteobacteria bacterium]
MTITVDDVKLLKSQRLTDEADGGGRATGEAIVDNEINNLFPDISRLDRTLGRINLRKVFAGVVTENQDRYLGAHCIITRKPGDDLVHALMFNTGSQTDEREEARNFIEGYVMPSITADFDLFGDQYAGQRALSCIAFENRRIPEAGDVYQLVTDSTFQYVRVTSVQHELREYTVVHTNGTLITFTRRFIKLDISAPLLNTYPGGQPTLTGVSDRNLDGVKVTRVRSTEVADSARYFGVNQLSRDAAAGTLDLEVDSIYAQLVPNSIRENALVDQIAGTHKRYYLASSAANRTLTLNFTSTAAGESRSFIGTGAYRGSVELTIQNGTWRDNGAGEFRLQSGSAAFDRIAIDYEVGAITAYRASAFTGTASVTYRPGAAVTGQSITGEIEIALGNRGYAYTLNLAEAKPRPGTLTVSFMALGRWYVLRDEGDGKLVGEGAGSVDFATGSVSLTLTAMPDVNTSIIYDYIAQDDFNLQLHSGSVTQDPVRILHELADKDIDPASVVVRMTRGGVEVTLTGSSSGALSGSIGSGFIYAAEGVLDIRLEHTVDLGSVIEIEYSFSDGSGSVLTNVTAGADGAGMSTGTIPGAPFKPGSVSITWDAKQRGVIPVFNSNKVANWAQLDEYNTEKTLNYSVADDGNSGWRSASGAAAIDGFINYETGEFALRTEQAYNLPEYYVNYRRTNGPELGTVNTEARESFAGTLICRAQKVSAVYAPRFEHIAAPQMQLHIVRNAGGGIVPGSLIFTWAGITYIDRDGVLYKDIDSRTNAGIAVGRIDYMGGTVTLATWPSNAATTGVNVLACVTAAVGFSTSYAFFRTPGAPLRPASLQITAVRADTGEVITATPNLRGEIAEGAIHGSVDVRTGIVKVRFTDDPNDETDLSTVQVVAAQLRYNAVLQTSMPMDAKLLGLDPVRLPADGRVPIYRDGDVLVIHHTGKTPATTTPGSTVTLSRYGQAEIYVVDSKDNRLDPAQYTTDREAGTLTWANPVLIQDEDGEPLTPPLTICDRVEHMTVCTEVQITGAVSINSPLPWDLPATETFVSSALTWGDMQARLYRWFTQKTWNTGSPNWTDNPIGDQTTAQYNSLNYPPEVANMGSISGKWAIVFTSTTSFQVVEQKLGVIATGSTANDLSPINPATSTPYFTIRAEGWGTGWASGNAIRFNTDACLGPAWLVRTVLAGKGTMNDDNFKLQVRGDAD